MQRTNNDSKIPYNSLLTNTAITNYSGTQKKAPLSKQQYLQKMNNKTNKIVNDGESFFFFIFLAKSFRLNNTKGIGQKSRVIGEK